MRPPRARLGAQASYICRACSQNVSKRPRRFATAAAPDVFDIVIVGGGPAGLSLLAALRSFPSTSHLRIALLETQSLDKLRGWTLPPDQYSNRASSITPSSRAFLERIGTWDKLEQSRVRPYLRMRVWDALSASGRIGFDSRPRDGPIGYMTENLNLTKALASQTATDPGITVLDNTAVASIALGPLAEETGESLDLSLYPHLTLSTHRTIAARLLVGADGINGPVRKFAGINVHGWDYGQHGVVATLRNKRGSLEASEYATAFQRFLPTGPIAMLPMANGYSTLVWTTSPERASRLQCLSATDFLATVNAGSRLSVVDLDYMFRQESGQAAEYEWRSSVYPKQQEEISGLIPVEVDAVQEGSIAAFPLRMRQASTYVSNRIALIGDAAHVVHPLAGQGLNMGLGDAECLATTIRQAVEEGADIGTELNCLERYNSEMWMRNWSMLGAIDKLHWLYRASNPLVTGVRGLGLGVVDKIAPLKDWFMRQAGGS